MTSPDSISDPLERIAASVERIEAVLTSVVEAYLMDRRKHQDAVKAIADAKQKVQENLRSYYEEHLENE